MNFIVTGSTGFVGRNTVRKLLDGGHKVTAVTTNSSISDDCLGYINGSEIVFVHKLSELAEHYISGNVVIHCAWSNVQNTMDTCHYYHSIEQLEFLEKICEYKPKKIIITGTCYEFGLSYGPVSVSDTPRPNTPYAHAKNFIHKAAEKIIKESTDIDFIWARLFYMYGSGQHEKSIYTQLINAIERGDSSFNMSKGEQLYDYMDVNKVAECLSYLATNDAPQIVHVCNGYPVSLRNLVEGVLEEKHSSLKLDLGYYPYRLEDSLAIWGAESFGTQMQL